MHFVLLCPPVTSRFQTTFSYEIPCAPYYNPIRKKYLSG